MVGVATSGRRNSARIQRQQFARKHAGPSPPRSAIRRRAGRRRETHKEPRDELRDADPSDRALVRPVSPAAARASSRCIASTTRSRATARRSEDGRPACPQSSPLSVGGQASRALDDQGSLVPGGAWLPVRIEAFRLTVNGPRLRKGCFGLRTEGAGRSFFASRSTVRCRPSRLHVRLGLHWFRTCGPSRGRMAPAMRNPLSLTKRWLAPII